MLMLYLLWKMVVSDQHQQELLLLMVGRRRLWHWTCAHLLLSLVRLSYYWKNLRFVRRNLLEWRNLLAGLPQMGPGQ